MAACVLCEPFSAHKAYGMGILTDIVPALKVDGQWVANPLVETQRMLNQAAAAEGIAAFFRVERRAA